MTTLVEPSQLGYSKIYLDFLAERDSASSFYRASDLKSVAEQLDRKSFPRDRMADILTRQNKAFGAGEKTVKNIESLREQNTLCVFAGQQAVLFGGPLLVQIKALGIIKAALRYSEELGRTVIPIFWIAGDDHDFEEVNHTWVLNRQSEIVRVSYDATPDTELPTAQLKLSDAEALGAAKEALKEVLGETDFTTQLYDLVDECYTTDDTFVSAFGKFMARLMADYGLVLFNPCDREAKEAGLDFARSILEKQDELHRRLHNTNNEIQSRGYHVQVEKKDTASHVMVNLDGRTPVIMENGHFAARDRTFSRDELLELISSEPGTWSPDVMTRPLLQSYLFPVLSQKGGPAEIAYLAQINPIFELFDIVPPLHKARPTATFVETRYEKLMEEHDIKFEDLTGDIEQVINRILAESFPEDLEKKFEELRGTVEGAFEKLKKESLSFDPQLDQFADQMYGKVDYTLNQLKGKVFSSHKKKSKQSRDRIYRLHNTLYPNRGLQERALNIGYFFSKYSFDFLDFAHEQLDSEEKSHQLIFIGEMHD